MRRALSLARKAQGSVSPNPPVGAVVVKDGVVVGEGWTQPPGQAHAEIVAIEEAGGNASGAVLYTTLEPCNHDGRTPPCTQAIMKAGIPEVRAATIDPNPKVQGGGLAQLAEAGVRTVVGQDEQQAREVMEGYLKVVGTGLPFVTAKFAMSLDGKLATRTGDSKWVTGERARWHVHRLRAASDAIMVGVNTVIADDPQLTARNERGEANDRQPLRVIADSRGRLPNHARLLSEPGRTLLAVVEPTDVPPVDAEIEQIPGKDGRVDLERLLRLLAGEKDVSTVLVEGGGTLLGSLFDGGLVDKVVAFVAPTIIGGDAAPTPVGGEGVGHMADALKLERVKVQKFGRDVAIVGYC